MHRPNKLGIDQVAFISGKHQNSPFFYVLQFGNNTSGHHPHPLVCTTTPTVLVATTHHGAFLLCALTGHGAVEGLGLRHEGKALRLGGLHAHL